MPVAATGVRHSSSPESRYETSLALVVHKRLYTDILTNTTVHISVEKWLLPCSLPLPNLFSGGDSCFPFEMYDAVSTFYLTGFAGFARIVLRLIRSLGLLIELCNLT
jgi:hypothetical protein